MPGAADGSEPRPERGAGIVISVHADVLVLGVCRSGWWR